MGKKKLKSKKPASLAEHLSKNKLWKKPIAKDGSCLFRAIAEQASLFSRFNWSLYDPFVQPLGECLPRITSRSAPQMRRLHSGTQRPF